MKTFFFYHNKDAGMPYFHALLAAGYEQVFDLRHADFIVYDHESAGWRRDRKKRFIASGKPAFIYPHTPHTCWLWDGIYESLPVVANIVAAPGQAQIMQAYGYPYPVEACGFARCDVLPFQKTKGRNLLFVPARPRRDHGRQEKLDCMALDFVLKHRKHFDNVWMCAIGEQFAEVGDEVTRVQTNPGASASPAQEMIARIDLADIVLAVHTPAYLSVAQGKPTWMYGQDRPPETIAGRAVSNYDKYKNILAYPLDLTSGIGIEEFLLAQEEEKEPVKKWKANHIGNAFDTKKFIEAIEHGWK